MNVSIARSPDVFQALARVSRAGSFDWGETTSHVQILLDSESNKVRQVWLATDLTSGRDVGMAMLSDPTPDSQGLQVLNLFVDDNPRGQGLGQSLISAVLEEYSVSTVAAYYTTNAVRLYHRAGSDMSKQKFVFMLVEPKQDARVKNISLSNPLVNWGVEPKIGKVKQQAEDAR